MTAILSSKARRAFASLGALAAKQDEARQQVALREQVMRGTEHTAPPDPYIALGWPPRTLKNRDPNDDDAACLVSSPAGDGILALWTATHGEGPSFDDIRRLAHQCVENRANIATRWPASALRTYHAVAHAIASVDPEARRARRRTWEERDMRLAEWSSK